MMIPQFLINHLMLDNSIAMLYYHSRICHDRMLFCFILLYRFRQVHHKPQNILIVFNMQCPIRMVCSLWFLFFFQSVPPHTLLSFLALSVDSASRIGPLHLWSFERAWKIQQRLVNVFFVFSNLVSPCWSVATPDC